MMSATYCLMVTRSNRGGGVDTPNDATLARLLGVLVAASKKEDVDKGCHWRVRDFVQRRQGLWQV